MATVVLAIAGFFLSFAYFHGGPRFVGGYPLTAAFADAGGLMCGADVSVGGIKIGTVTDVRIDQRTEDAVVRMSIRPDLHLPADSVAVIQSTEPTGEKFIELQPGHDKQTIPNGGAIAKVKNYEPLEATVGRMIFSTPDGQATPQESNTSPDPARR
jgi:phospholipid/cholesterol/gamma-HCH transport system substrate-binding protein